MTLDSVISGFEFKRVSCTWSEIAAIILKAQLNNKPFSSFTEGRAPESSHDGHNEFQGKCSIITGFYYKHLVHIRLFCD